MSAPHEARFSGPESHDAVDALTRTRRSIRPLPVVVGIVLSGVILSALAAWVVARVDRSTEQRLLQGQTRQAAAVLSTAILNIQQPMSATLDAQKLAQPGTSAAVFRQAFGDQVGGDGGFVSASLWRSDSTAFVEVTALGAAPGLDAGSAELNEFLARAVASDTTVVERVERDAQTRIAFAMADAEEGWIVYGERAIPADRRSRVDRDSAFADLSYAIYLGPETDTSELTTTDVDPADLPLTGLTYRSSVPFGDTELTLVTSPRRHLGSALSRWLPLVLLLGGALLTGTAAFVAQKLVRTRVRAEQDTDTITTLYQRVDSLYGEQRDLFVRLQRALLPQANPEIPGIEIGSEYVAGAQGIDIGGDWYSVIGIGDDRFAFVVGDVSGNGIDAVAEMARARFTLRAYLLDGSSPGEALEKASRQFDVMTDGHIVTALVGVGNSETGEVAMANAGHPLPLLVSTEGADFVTLPVGRPLGAGRCAYETTTFTVPAGATLLCYTDGLIERRGEDIDTGMERLVATVRPIVDEPLDALIDDVIATMRDESHADDIAVLALRRAQARLRLRADQEAPASARAFVREALSSRVLPNGVLVDDVVLASSELVTNAVRAGANDVELTLNGNEAGLVLAVADDASGWPELTTADADAVNGRGLSIVEQLSDSWAVLRTATGKRVSVTWVGTEATS